jgi:hypothetical protein
MVGLSEHVEHWTALLGVAIEDATQHVGREAIGKGLRALPVVDAQEGSACPRKIGDEVTETAVCRGSNPRRHISTVSPLEQAGFEPLVPRRRRREVSAGEVCLPFTSEVDVQSQFTSNLSYLTINSLMKLTVQV